MARITIEDCMEQVPNRFQLVRMAAIRAKQLKKGARPLVSAEDNKHVVISLREIAAGLVKPGDEPLTPAERAPVRPAPPPPTYATRSMVADEAGDDAFGRSDEEE